MEKCRGWSRLGAMSSPALWSRRRAVTAATQRWRTTDFLFDKRIDSGLAFERGYGNDVDRENHKMWEERFRHSMNTGRDGYDSGCSAQFPGLSGLDDRRYRTRGITRAAEPDHSCFFFYFLVFLFYGRPDRPVWGSSTIIWTFTVG